MKHKLIIAGLSMALTLSMPSMLLGAETATTSIAGIEAGTNVLEFNDCTKIKSIRIYEMEVPSFSLSLDSGSSKQTTQIDKSVIVTYENLSGKEMETVFDSPGQWSILAQYLKGELSPKDAYDKIERTGELDIRAGQNRSSSLIYQFFCFYHPGYSELWVKNLHPVYQPK